MLYLYKKTTSTGTTIGITEATSERHLAERVLAAIPKDENIIALSGDALPDGLITLPALMDAVQELMAKEDNAHATDPNHIIEIAGETGLHLAKKPDEEDEDECDGDCANCECREDCEEENDDFWEDEDEEDGTAAKRAHGGEADDFLSFLKNAINAYENRHNNN